MCRPTGSMGCVFSASILLTKLTCSSTLERLDKDHMKTIMGITWMTKVLSRKARIQVVFFPHGWIVHPHLSILFLLRFVCLDVLVKISDQTPTYLTATYPSMELGQWPLRNFTICFPISEATASISSFRFSFGAWQGRKVRKNKVGTENVRTKAIIAPGIPLLIGSDFIEGRGSRENSITSRKQAVITNMKSCRKAGRQRI